MSWRVSSELFTYERQKNDATHGTSKFQLVQRTSSSSATAIKIWSHRYAAMWLSFQCCPSPLPPPSPASSAMSQSMSRRSKTLDHGGKKRAAAFGVHPINGDSVCVMKRGRWVWFPRNLRKVDAEVGFLLFYFSSGSCFYFHLERVLRSYWGKRSFSRDPRWYSK